MIEETLFKSNFLGKDGFIWWLGQVAPPEVWDIPSKVSINFVENEKAWAARCKVRIIGYHTYDRNELSDNDLPWAHIMMGPTDGNAQGGYGKTHKLVGGETVFGFFLDGDDAQQPVISGVLYRNSNVQNFPIDDIAFKPFPGTGANSRITQGPTKQLNVSTQLSPPNPASGISSNTNSPISSTVSNVKNASDKFFPNDKALQVAYATVGSKKILSENGCNDNIIGKITSAIQNFIATVTGLQSYLNTYIDPVLNVFVDIQNEIRNTTRIIVGAMKFLINNMRNVLMKIVGNLFSQFVGLVVPIPQQPIVGEAAKNIINIIFCLFENILDIASPFIEDLLSRLVGNVINAPLCAIEEFIAAILSQVLSIIDELLGPVVSGLDWLMSGASQISSILSQASSIATQIFNLIGCDNLKCEAPSEWSLNSGPSAGQYDNWNRVVSKMNIIDGFGENLNVSINSLSIYGYGSDAGLFNECYQRVNSPQSQSDLVSNNTLYVNCLPPEVEIYGDGFGAYAIPVVGTNGSILSIELINSGYGYSVLPNINIIDNTNYGSGAKANAILENGKISQIYLTSAGSGYCETNLNNIIRIPYYVIIPNRYSLYEGETCEFSIFTENVLDGTILTYSLGGDISSDDVVNDLVGNVLIFNNQAIVPITISQDTLNEQLEELVFDLLDSDQNIVARAKILINDKLSPIVQPTLTKPPLLGVSTYFPPNSAEFSSPVGIITSVVIISPGIGYTSGDVIDIGGVSVTPIVSPIGAIVGVTSIPNTKEFTEIPNYGIDSKTGEGLEFYPVLQYIPKTNTPGIILNQLGVIDVVDCV